MVENLWLSCGGSSGGEGGVPATVLLAEVCSRENLRGC